MARGSMTTGPQLATLADSLRLPQGLLHWLVSNPVGDVDVIALDVKVMDDLRQHFGINFRKVTAPNTHVHYFIGKPQNANGMLIHLVLLRSHTQAICFVMNNQYDVDRAMISNHRVYFDPAIGLDSICDAIRDKCATLVQGPRDMTHFAFNRPQVEQRHKLRLTWIHHHRMKSSVYSLR
jgi:hypothetical protein